jgi:hypothetical protein
MAIIVLCESCGKSYRFGREHIGKNFRCKNCDKVLKVKNLLSDFENLDVTEEEVIASSGKAPHPKPELKGKGKPSASEKAYSTEAMAAIKDDSDILERRKDPPLDLQEKRNLPADKEVVIPKFEHPPEVKQLIRKATRWGFVLGAIIIAAVIGYVIYTWK